MNLYISNIGKMVTNESLRAIFATHGQVDFITMTRDENGILQSHALVEMPHESEAMHAINKLNGCIINGSCISVAKNPGTLFVK